MNTITGAATYFLEADTNTDVIIPARFLKRVHLKGFEPFAFYERRYHPETICEASLEKKDFILKKPVYNPDFPPNHPHAQDAVFLLTWLNFGCGSSREHAVYSLANYKVIIGGAPEGKNAFADIFRDNCRQNLIWTPVLNEADHRKLANYLMEQLPKKVIRLSLHLTSSRLTSEDEQISLPYTLPEHHRSYILAGEDPFTTAKKEIATTQAAIQDWRKQNQQTVETYPLAR